MVAYSVVRSEQRTVAWMVENLVGTLEPQSAVKKAERKVA